MANNVFDNKVIEGLAKDLLRTSLNTRSLMTIDDDLQENAGMTKTIATYTYTGNAEELAKGIGNTAGLRGSIGYAAKDYTVKVVQQAFDYYDEDALKDPQIVDMMTKGASQVMANKLTSDYFNALGISARSVNYPKGSKISYETIVDAIASMNIEDESELFLLIPPSVKGDLRKDPDFKAAQLGEVVYNGQVGTIAGIPVIVTKNLSTGWAYLTTKSAVKCFIKKDVEVEQERDPDTRKNSVYLRTAYIVAVVDNTKVVKITESAT